MLTINNLCSAFRQRQSSTEVAALLNESINLIRSELSNLNILLCDLNVKDYSIVHAAVYYFKLAITSTESNQFKELLDKVGVFVSSCSKSQIRSYPEYFVILIQEICKKPSQTLFGDLRLKIAIKAVHKLQKDASELTPLHFCVSQLAVLTMKPEAAMPIIDNDILDIHVSVDPTSFEMHYYFSGVVYLALKRYEKAQFCMELCLLNPTTTINKTIREAYKKYCLLSILNSKFDRASERVLFSQRLERQLKEIFKTTYGEIVYNFNQRCLNRLLDVVRVNRIIFEQDKNYGIIKQIIRFYKEREVLLLTKVYLSLTLTELTDLLQSDSNDETEDLLFSMISRGILAAKIDEKEGMVTFLGDDQDFQSINFNYGLKNVHLHQFVGSMTNENKNCDQLMLILKKKMEDVLELRTNIQKLNDKMSLNPLYLKKVVEREMVTSMK